MPLWVNIDYQLMNSGFIKLESEDSTTWINPTTRVKQRGYRQAPLDDSAAVTIKRN